MKNKLGLSLLLIFIINSPPLAALDPLSNEDLKPFCNNERIWIGLNIDPDQCMKEALICSRKNTTTNILDGTQKLYACVFNALGIVLPDDVGDEFEDNQEWDSEQYDPENENYFDEYER